MAGRNSKRTPEVYAEIVRLLAAGCLVQDICAKVNISENTYFRWLKEDREFREATTRAKAEANTHAAEVIRSAMAPHDVTSKTVKTFSETRLRRVGDEQLPYTYVREEKGATVTHEMGDWRAALEFLKRRDPDNWSEHLIIRVDPGEAALLKEHGLTAAEAWAAMMKQLAEAKNDANG